MRAAPIGVAIALSCALVAVPAAHASRRAPAAAAAQAPRPVWGLEISQRAAPALTAAKLARARAAGVNALIVRGRQRALRRKAARAGLRRLVPLAPRGRRGRSLQRACRRRAVCLVRARSPAGARRLARGGAADLAMARFRRPGGVVRARLPRRGRLLAVVPLAARRQFQTAGWSAAIARARQSGRLDLAVTLTGRGPRGRAALDSYLGLLRQTIPPAPGPPGPQPPGEGVPSGPVPTPQTPANPPPSVFVSPLGSDANPCTRQAPCQSFERGYRVAQPGEGIELAGGSYPSQTIEADESKLNATDYVFFFPAPGAIVQIDGDLTMGGSHAVFRGTGSNFRLHNLYSEASYDAEDTSRHVIFDGLDGAGFQIGPTHDVTIKGGDWGPVTECAMAPSQQPKVTPEPQYPGQMPTNIVLDGLYIHDVNSLDLVQCHTGGMIVESAIGFALRNTRFSQTAVYGIQVGDFTGEIGNPRNVVIENNWFGAPVFADGVTNDGQPEIQVAENGVFDDWLIRFNSFHNGISVTWDQDATHSNFRVIANVGGESDCQAAPAVTWAYNVWTESDSACSPTDRVVGSLPYVNAAVGGEDFHLTGGAAQDLVTPSTPDYDLATDIDGQARPRGAARDAGADER
jgi:hypothetical protein